MRHMSWCRLYANDIENPKVELLPDKTFRVYIRLMALMTKYGNWATGDIQLDTDEINHIFREDIEPHLITLNNHGLISYKMGFVTLKNWTTDQYISDHQGGSKRKQEEKKQKSVQDLYKFT